MEPKVIQLRKASPDFLFQDNYTALHIAVESAKPAVVETLLGYGAEVHVRGASARPRPNTARGANVNLNRKSRYLNVNVTRRRQAARDAAAHRGPGARR